MGHETNRGKIDSVREVLIVRHFQSRFAQKKENI